MPALPHDQPLTALLERLRRRRDELKQAILTRVYGIADPTTVAERSYVAGLRRAVSAALDFALAAVEFPANAQQPPPVELLSQARLAARSGVSLDTVLRRYCAGNALFADALVEEAERAGLPGSEVQRLLRVQASGFDRLLAAVGDEYAREADLPRHGSKQLRIDLLRRLLAGELLDPSDLRYDFDAHHLGILASGHGVSAALVTLGEGVDRHLLLAEPEQQIAWAWLGGRRPFDPDELDSLSSFPWPEQTAVAFGEPARGLPGWRLTHRQAVAALPIAQRGAETVVHHADVALLASALQDDLLASSLRQAYLAPLESARDGGATAKDTLRAYFAAARNSSSAAAALGVSRRTISNRLAAIEEGLGRPLDTISAELETALRLDELKAA